MAAAASQNGITGITARWADMVLEDEDEAFVPVELGGTETGAGVIETWPVVGWFLTDRMVKLEYMR